MTKRARSQYGVHSEVGQLRKVMVCAPASPINASRRPTAMTLLFDDVLWVDNAKRDHFDFVHKMRDRGVDVVEMHNLLAETVADPGGERSGSSTTRSCPTRSVSASSTRSAVILDGSTPTSSPRR